MARVKTLAEKVSAIKRKYKKVNAQKFFYNKPGELRKRYKRITSWYLIHDSERGYSIMKMDWKRKAPMQPAEWARLHKEGVGEMKSLYSIFTQAVLPAINNKGGNAWHFISLLGWAGIADDVRPAKNSAASRRRNKTSKKRNANARRRNRR